jgi:replicative DNA helicase
MSAGKRFIRSVIEAETPKVLRRADLSWFTEDEQPVFEMVLKHLSTYGSLPDENAVKAAGHALPQHSTSNSPEYYLDVLKRRFAYSAVNEKHPQLVECMKNKDFDGLLATLRQMTLTASSVLESESYVSLSEEMVKVTEEYYEAKFNPGLRGVPFGWDTLDKATSGAQGGDLIVVAGRPSLGKSWMLLQMGRSAHKAGKSVCFTSMEMSLRQIARRWLAMEMKVNPNFIKEGELSTASEGRMMDMVEQMAGASPVYLLAGDMSKKVSGVENMVAEFNPDIIIIDAAYLLSPSGAKKGYISRWEAITEVIRELKALALRVDKPIIISVQFNRNQKSDSKKGADLSDIAGADSIPQDASIVLGLRKGPAPNQNTQRIIDTMKNREGDTPTFATSFSFSPLDFSEVPMTQSEEGEGTEGESFDGSWMD